MVQIDKTFSNDNATYLFTELMQLIAERMGNFPEEAKLIDKKVWENLLIYKPSAVGVEPQVIKFAGGKNLRMYVLCEDSDFFGFKMPKGTVYKQNKEDKDYYECYRNENDIIMRSPSFDLHFMIIINNRKFVETFAVI